MQSMDSKKCRRKVLVSIFGETKDISCPTNRCDVCKMELGTLYERRQELILTQEIGMGLGWSDRMD